MSDEKINQILDELSKPFHPSRITWRPGALTGKKDKALALAYADLRAYQNRLDEVCGMDWSVSYTPWGDRIICHLTINGITRSSTGEADSDSERSEIAGTSAEAQAFKRACAMFGLGRYLYSLPSLWVEYDAPNQRFTEKSKARLHSIIAQHYQRFLNGQPASTLDAPAEEVPEDVQVAEPVRATEETTSTEPIRQAHGEPVRQAQAEPTRPVATKGAPKQVKEAPAPTNGAANSAVNGTTNGAANGNGAHAAETSEPQDEALLPLRKKLDELGKELYGEQWAHVRAHNIKRLVGEQTDGNTTLSKEQMQTLINGLKKLKQQRQAA
ncbi:MAG: hypothetical protein DYG89_05120 [Caldilinea sp. CFX5]|nr:hypothetical protein [Caldilinea sp. CFX5]